ncbi:hypothetical protein BDQ17DRAFT_1392463 [Cyathus striatus]|nr:hypothetical protein BDQ17DRAFT_1392463 [Cyathus striatus]
MFTVKRESWVYYETIDTLSCAVQRVQKFKYLPYLCTGFSSIRSVSLGAYQKCPVHFILYAYFVYLYRIGGGSAGCVLVNRLSQDPKASVLVIERSQVCDNWASTVRLSSSDFAPDHTRTRKWETTSQDHIENRVIQLITGSSLGGSSKVNTMLYTRGLPGKFNLWASEEKAPDQNVNSVETFHGISGEWQNRSHKTVQWGHTRHIIDAAKSLGLPYINDLNSPLRPSHGCAKMHYTIDKLSHRGSTLTSRGHLHISVGNIIRQIEIVNDSHSAKAEGVWVQAASGSGVGIGPPEHLREHGITVTKDLSGVGSHLFLFLYLLFGTGLLAPMLDISIFIQPRLFSGSKTNASKHRKGGLSFYNTLLRSTAEGTVRLASSDPTASPLIDPNYLSTRNAWEVMRKCLRFALRLKEQFAKQDYPFYVRMGSETNGGVNLRVADSSIFPNNLSTHLQAPTVAVAEKCSDDNYTI